MADAYAAGLRLLARRELSEAQVRERLARRQFPAPDIDAAVARLLAERALDDGRTARACARTEAHVRRHGRRRALRRLEALGIDRALARAAVAEVFDELDETVLIAQAIDRRLRGGTAPDDPAARQRLHRHLVARGFDPDRVAEVLRRRAGAS